MNMEKNDDISGVAVLSAEEKKRQLYEQQKATLDAFLERNAITQAQYDKSLHDLTLKMGYTQSSFES